MSEIRVTTLKDTAGSNSSTSAEIFNGRAKAWVNFNGSGTVAIRNDYNVNTVSDRGQGQYTVNFSSALSSANYAAVGQSSDSGYSIVVGTTIAPFQGVAPGDANPTSSAYQFSTCYATNSFQVRSDMSNAYLAFFE